MLHKESSLTSRFAQIYYPSLFQPGHEVDGLGQGRLQILDALLFGIDLLRDLDQSQLRLLVLLVEVEQRSVGLKEQIEPCPSIKLHYNLQ